MGHSGGRRSVPLYQPPINTPLPVPTLSMAGYEGSVRVSGVFASRKYNRTEIARIEDAPINGVHLRSCVF